jgi:hypothetical protein
LSGLAADLDTARRFFERFLAGVDGGWVSFRHRSPGAALAVDWAPATDLDEILAVVERRAPFGDLWFGVGLRYQNLGGRRGGKQDVAAFTGLWLDVDIEGPGHATDEPQPVDVEDALSLLDDHPVPPSLVVHSGGGLQPYWLFDHYRPAADVEPLLAPWHELWAARAAERGWALDNVSEAAREMRVPGSWNWKLVEPRPVTLLD